MKVGKWSTTANNNNATPPDGWPEGQAPSTVNDCAREMMASIRTMLNDVSFIDLDHTPTQTGSTTFTLPGNVVSFYDVGRRVKAFNGASTLYGTVISSSFTTNTGISLRLDSGVLTSSLSSIATSVLSNTNQAIPDSIARAENIIINGQLDIWQENTLFSISGPAGAVIYTADMFLASMNSTAILNVSRLERSASASNVPTLAQTGIVINNAMQISVSTVDATIAAGDYCYISTPIQGANWRQIAHKPFTYSFWAHTNRTGTYCVAFRNGASDRSYVKEFTISANNTWEKKTFVIPEAPTTGTWDYSFGCGIECHITLAAGTTFHATDGAWTSMNALATSNQINFLASAGHTIRFADFRLTEGTQVLPLKPRLYQQELALCQRHYQKSYDYSVLGGTVTSTGRWGYNATSVGNGALIGKITFPVPMNSTPSVTFYSPSTGAINQVNGAADYTATASDASPAGFNPVNVSGATQTGLFCHWVASARLR